MDHIKDPNTSHSKTEINIYLKQIAINIRLKTPLIK
jgi:hypothetical protein